MYRKLYLRPLYFFALAAAVAFVGCVESRAPSEPRQPTLTEVGRDSDEGVIVMLSSPDADPQVLANSVITVHGGHLRYIFWHGTRGFSAILPASAVNALRQNPLVKYIEPIQFVAPVDHASQARPTWGINRIDQRSLPLDTLYYYSGTGSGVTAYIIDTGIRTTHTDFGGRASLGFDVFGGNGEDAGPDPTCAGHGTHVAGTVGGTTYGVAKQVALRAVRVIDCNATTPDSIDHALRGIDSVIGNHATPAVANISLAALDVFGRETTSQAFDDKVRDLIAAGITTIVSAGNDNVSACGVSPARVDSAITVAASTSSDARWVTSSTSGSNFGPCVDVFAPGRDITSAWWTSNTATNTITGTSMAAPHTTGVAALYLQRVPAAAPTEVAAAITSRATLDVLTGVATGSPNRLLHPFFVEVAMSGPSGNIECGTHTWNSSVSGVGMNYTYLWQRRNGALGTWQTVGTGPSLTLNSWCPWLSGTTIRVTATSEAGFHALDWRNVW